MKLVVKNTIPQNTTSIDNFDSEKLYFLEENGKIYKLHRVRDDKYAFVGMQNSDCWSFGIHETAIAAIVAEIDAGGCDVYEFDSLREALKWMLEDIGV